MKKFLLIFLSICIAAPAFSQTWNGTTSTAWEDASNWSTGLVPTTLTDVIIPTSPTGGRFPLISIGTQGVKSFTIQSGATVSQSGGTLQIVREWKNSGTFNASGGTVQFAGSPGASANYSTGTNNLFHVVINSGVDPDFSDEVGGVINIAGDFTNNNATLANQTSLISFNFNGTGNQNFYSASANTICGNFNINKSGGTLSFGSAIKVVNATLTAGTINTNVANYAFTATGNVQLNGGALALNASTVAVTGNWTNAGCAVTGDAASVTVSGDYTRSSGSYGAATSTLSIGGNFVNNTSGSFLVSAVSFTGTAKTISGTNSPAFPSLTVTGSVTLNVNATATSLSLPASAAASSLSVGSGISLAVSGDINIQQPTASVITALNINAGTVNVSGNVNLGGNNTTTGRVAKIVITSGTLDVTGNLTFNSAASTSVTAVIDMSGGAGNLKLNGSVFLTNNTGTLSPGSTSTVEFYGTAAQALSQGGAMAYNHIKINKTAGTVSQSAALSMSGNLQIIQGDFTTTTSHYALTAAGLILSGGSLSLNNSVVTINGNYNNTGTTITGGTCAVTVTGDFTRAGGTFTASSATLSVGGNWINNLNATQLSIGSITLTGATKTIGGSYSTSFKSLLVSGSVTMNANCVATSFTIPAVSSASSLTLTTGISFTIDGDVVINQPISSAIAGLNVNAGLVTINGNLNIGGSNTSTGRVAKVVLTTGVLDINGNLVYNSAASTSVTAAIEISGAGTLYLSGNLVLTNGSGTLTPGTQSEFIYDGSTDQTLQDASAILYNTLVVGKVSGSLTLASNLTVGGNFRLDNGTFSTSASNYSLTAINFTLNGGSLYLNNSAMTATGNYVHNSTTIYGATCSLAVSGDYTRNGGLNLATNYSITVGGNFVNNVSAALAAVSATLTGTAKTISGTYPLAFQALTITTGTITANINISSTSLTMANNGVANSFTLADGVTATVSGNVVLNQAITNVVHSINVNAGTMNVGGDVTLAVTANNAGRAARIVITTGTLNITGNLVLNNTYLAANAAIDMSGGAGTLNITGNFTVNTLGTFTAGTASTIRFNGSGSQSIPAFNYFNLTSTSTGSRVLAPSGIIGIAGTFNAGTNSYTTTGSTVDFNGSVAQTIPALSYNNLTSSSTGARILPSTGTIGIAGVFTPGANSYTITGSTIDFNGSVSQTIPAINYNNLTSSSTGARVLASTGTIGIAGTFTPGANTFTNSGSTINYNGSSQPVAALNYLNLIFSGSGVKTYSTGTSTVDYLQIATGATFQQTGGSITTSGTATSISGKFEQTGGTFQSSVDLLVNSGGTLEQSGGLIHLAANTSINPTDDLIIAAGATANQTGGTMYIRDYAASPGTFNQYGASAVFQVFHDWKPGAASIFNSTAGTVQFKGTAGGGTNFAVGTRQFHNLLIDAGIDYGLNNEVGGTISIGGNYTNNNASLPDPLNSSFTFNGAGNQTIYSASAAATFSNLTVNKSSGVLSLISNANFSGNVSVSGGTFDLSTFTCNRTIAGGTFTVTNGAKLSLGGNGGGQAGSNFPLNVNVNLGATSTVEYNGSNSITQTIYAAPTYGHLNLVNSSGSSTAAKITIANLTVNGNLTVDTSVQLTPGTGNTIGGSGTLTGAGIVQVTRTAATPDFLSQYTISNRSLTNLTVDFSAAANQSVNGLSYGNLKFSGSGIKTATGNVIVTNDLNLEAATFGLSTQTLTVNKAIGRTSGVIDGVNGTFELAGSVAQTITAGIFQNNALKNLKISNNAGVALGGTMELNGALTFGSVNNAVFSTGNHLQLKSTATNTARIADVTNAGANTGNNITGNVIIERYFPDDGRRYRLFTPGVNAAASIRTNWMEGAMNTSFCNTCNDNPKPGYGTHITGAGGNANGFDVTTTNASSLFTFNQSTGGWVAVGNTSIVPSTNTPYLIFIRGDRSVDMTILGAPLTLASSGTTLRTTGSLQVGTKAFTSLASNGAFSLISNPFASPISWTSMHANNSSNFENYYTYWEAKSGSRGAYVTVTSSGLKSNGTVNATVEIQSGQAVFVKTKTGVTAPALNIREVDKSTTSNINVFRTGTHTEQLNVSLFTNEGGNGQRLNLDGVLAAFNNNYTPDIDGNDAFQIANWDEDIAIVRENKLLSIETRPLIEATDTIYLSVARLKHQDYEWQFDPASFADDKMQAYLVDNYAGTLTAISLTKQTIVSFTVTSNAATSAANRFMIVFLPAATLPVRFTAINAYEQGKNVKVEWQTAAEENIEKYIVERSTDGRNFTNIDEQVAKRQSNNNAYAAIDATPAEGINYYRIRAIEANAGVKYSSVVAVKMGLAKSEASVYPNPITGNNFSLHLSAMPKGKYTVALYNAGGQQVLQQNIVHAGGSSVQTIAAGKELSAGIYQLSISGEGVEMRMKVLK